MKHNIKYNIQKICATAVCLTVLFAMCGCKDKSAETSSDVSTATPQPTAAAREYSAVMKPVREEKVYSDAKGEILECNAELGDYVEAGAVLYSLADNGIYDNIKTTRNSIEKANITIATATENEQNLKIYAPSSGIVKKLTVKDGERVNMGTVGTIANENEFVARVPFNAEQIKSISVGMTGEVVSDYLMSGTAATVTRIYSERNTSVSGAVLYDVELTGKNAGTMNEGMTVSAVIGGMESPTTGYITDGDDVPIVSRQSGNAANISVKEGDYVKKGALIMTIENSNITATARRARIDKEDLEIKLATLEKDAADLTIYSPISGIVTEKNKDKRDIIASKGDSIMTIADTSVLIMEFSLADGETAPSIGQEVTIACGDNITTQGTVTRSEGGAVTVEIQNSDGIPPYTTGKLIIHN